MCTVSMIGDHYRDMWNPKPWWPGVVPMVPAVPMPETPPPIIINKSDVSRAEFEELKRQVLEMKELLKRAKAYDEKNGEPDCEIDEKMEVLRKVAKLVGVDLDDVLAKR